MLKVHVIDEGKGIRPDDFDKLFKLFGKLNASADENPDGIGMGLMICKNIVSHYGGTISCYSAGENQGSTFMFSLKMPVVTKKRKKVVKSKTLEVCAPK